jgi:hypothetical protein
MNDQDTAKYVHCISCKALTSLPFSTALTFFQANVHRVPDMIFQENSSYESRDVATEVHCPSSKLFITTDWSNATLENLGWDLDINFLENASNEKRVTAKEVDF